MRRLTGAVFLDTNIPMYAAGREHPLREPARRVIRSVARGELDAFTDAEVFQEILSRYLRTDEPAAAFAVFDSFLRLMTGRVLPIDIVDMMRARALAEERPSLSPRDYVHWAVMDRHGIPVIVSADRHFDDIALIERVDPTVFDPS